MAVLPDRHWIKAEGGKDVRAYGKNPEGRSCDEGSGTPSQLHGVGSLSAHGSVGLLGRYDLEVPFQFNLGGLASGQRQPGDFVSVEVTQ